MENTYYTTEELAAATEKLLREGRPMTDIVKDPKCPPEMVAKMQHLANLMNDNPKQGGN